MVSNINTPSEGWNLSQDTVLGRLFIGQVGLSARSRTLSEEAAEKHQADRSSVRGIVQIITAQDRAEITQCINQARQVFYANTLPWDDNAYRLIPLVRYTTLKHELDTIQNAFDDAVHELVANYDMLRKDYHKRVNDLAQEVPFPAKDELERSFKFELIEMPISDTSDIRLRHVDPNVVEQMKVRINQQNATRLAEAQTEIISRLSEMAGRIKTQAGKEKGRLFESLVTNINDAVAVLPGLNVSQDPEITRLIEAVKVKLGSLDIEDMRDSSYARREAVKAADDVLKELQSYKPTIKMPVLKPAVTKAVALAPQPVAPANVPATVVVVPQAVEPVKPVEKPKPIVKGLDAFAKFK